MNTIRVVHNHAGNCINFYNSTQPVYWNGCLEASVAAGTTDRINIENNIRDVGAGSSIYEFFRVPYTLFVNADNVGFSSAQAAVDYINDAANTISQTNRFILSDSDTIDFKVDDSFSTILLDNGDQYPTDYLKASASGDNINITTRQASSDIVIYEGLRVANVTINGVGLGTTQANVVNDLNSLFTQTGGSQPPVISSASTITVGVGTIINYEATTTGGDVSAFEWTNLPEGVTQVTNHPQKIIGGSDLNAGTYTMTLRAHNYVGMAKTTITLNVTQDYTNSKSTSFDDTEYTIRTRQSGEFTNLQKSSGQPMPAHSYSMWFKAVAPGANQPNNQSVFFAFSQLGTFSGTSYIDLRWLGPQSTNQRLRLQYAVSGSSNRLVLLTDTGTIPADGTWKHIVVTYDGASDGLKADTPYTLKIYINGSEVITSSGDFTQGGGVEDNDGPIEPVYVGFGRNPNGFYMRQSLIDEFGYWNQELTSSQVSNLYNSGVPTDLTTFSPSAAHVYRMGDGDTFPTIEDKVGNADQTMTNMASSNFVTDTP
jgi:hypothetical protein